MTSSIKDRCKQFENQKYLSFSSNNEQGDIISDVSSIYEDDESENTVMFHGEIYDLPGLEHFVMNSDYIDEKADLKMPIIDKDETKDSTWVESLLEINEPEVIAKEIVRSLRGNPNEMGTKARKSIFSSLFRSKRKKNASKNKNTDSTVIDEASVTLDHNETVNDKRPSTNNNITNPPLAEDNESDSLNESINKPPPSANKVPLNHIFNRDWLNSLGDGIKKKAHVMSELRKRFTGGKFLSPKKKVYISNPKTESFQGINNENPKWSCVIMSTNNI